MKRILFVLLLWFTSFCSVAQTVVQNLFAAFGKFENDPQLKSGLASIYIVDTKTGKVVFEKKAKVGLAPASTQKIITSASAYEFLGKDFRYKTEFGLSSDKSTLYILPGGDPTLGSGRWNNTKESQVMSRIIAGVKKTGTLELSGLVVNELGWEDESIPDGWIWQDIGNYYGAAARKLNWRENQFDLILKSGKNIGQPVVIVGTVPGKMNHDLRSRATSAAKGSGDNAFIYFPINAGYGVVRGTIPVNESHFVISGALPPDENILFKALTDALSEKGIKNPGMFLSLSNYNPNVVPDKNMTIFHTEFSPPLDSIIFWLNKKSINLYAEALLRTISYKRTNVASSTSSIQMIKDFWKTRGIDQTELNIIDGSGLSPSNRVTTHALATILHYAKKQSWFRGFYNSLPDYNGMKMKSGTIAGAKGFTGYHTSRNGTEYAFSFLVNNYNGSSYTLVQKMYRVLDELK